MLNADLVALVTVYDALFATLGVLAVEGSLPDPSTFTNSNQFLVVVFITSFMAVLARLLYQRALSIAPLSLTVPYLAFTPAFVVLVSPIFLVGEVPSPLGMLGVFVVSISGYMLGLITTPGKGDQPSSPSKAKLPLLVSSVQKAVPGIALQLNQQECISQHSHKDMQFDNPTMAHHVKQQRQQQHHDYISGDQQYRRLSEDTSRERLINSKGKSKSSHLSVWAMAYYKGKTQQSLIHSGLQSGDQSQPSHIQWRPSNNDTVVVAADSLNDSHGSLSNGTIHRCRSEVDSQAKCGRQHKADKVAGARSSTANKAVKLLTDAFNPQRYPACLAVLSGPNAAPAMVLTAAFLYSVTASLDKLGIAAAGHNLAAYFLGQRLLLGFFGAVYLLSFGRSALRHMVHDMVLLSGISLSELGAVVFYLIAINNILVSYVVAIKRVNVLLSTLVGCVLFREQVRNRIPYIIAMLCGMLLIVLQPGHEILHHSHHTRHHQHHLLMLL